MPDISFPDYAEALFRIRNKSKDLVPFILNPPQMVVWAAIKRQMDAGRPIRVRVLKARQSGMSIFSIILSLWWVINSPGHQVLSIANKLELPAQWVRYLRRLLRQLKQQVADAPTATASNRTELYFDGLDGARYMIGSSLGETPGMGDTINGVHCSEIASWTDPDAILGDLLPALPPTIHTFVLQESTGRAMGDWWYQRYYEAKEHDNEYDSVFLPWFLSPEYDRDPLEGRTEEGRYTWSDLGELDADEKATLAYAQRYKIAIAHLYKMPDLSPGQMMWRRIKLRDDFHGDSAMFANQFPACETEAFLSEGENVFTQEQVRLAHDTRREPIARYDIDWSHWHPRNLKLFPNNESGAFKVFREYDDRYHYVVGADCQWGVTKTADFDSLFVQCLENDLIYASLKGAYDLAVWGKIIAGIGWRYNTAKVAPERNAKAANSVMPLLLGKSADWRYPNIYIRRNRMGIKMSGGKEWGWLTDEHTKGELVSYAKTATIEGHFDWCDEEAVDQMRAYIWDGQGRMTAPVGAHDDMLMARMITAKVAQYTKPVVDLYVEKQERKVFIPYTPLSAKLEAMANGTYHLEYGDEDGDFDESDESDE